MRQKLVTHLLKRNMFYLDCQVKVSSSFDFRDSNTVAFAILTRLSWLRKYIKASKSNQTASYNYTVNKSIKIIKTMKAIKLEEVHVTWLINLSRQSKLFFFYQSYLFDQGP